MSLKIKVFSIITLLFLAAGIYGKVFNLTNPKQFFASVYDNDSKIDELVASSSEKFTIGIRVKYENCQINGPLPDALCTPGAIFPNASTSDICVSGYTKTVRNVSTSLRKKVYGEYDILYPEPKGSYEVDHLIPLELGGSNDIANLFPEAASPKPGFPEKDLVENYLNQEVCAGRIALSDAQKQIANDWPAVYNALSREQITSLKNQYRNWSGN